MTTFSHKYLARTFYDQKTIDDVLAKNLVIDNGDESTGDDINFGNIEEKDHYDSIYEEQILKRTPGNDIYKVIPISGNGYAGKMVVVYDPAKITLGTAKYFGYRGQTVPAIAENYGALVATNASGFMDGSAEGKGSVPVGTVIQDGKVIWRGGDPGYGGGLIGFNRDNILMLTKNNPDEAIENGMRDAVQFGPFLIVNGEKAEMKGNGGWGIAPRTAIGQRKDGIVLLLVIDGRNVGYSLGIDMVEMTNIFARYGAHNAANLDGGGSSTLVVNNEVANIPCGSVCELRYVANAWIVK